MILIVTAGNVSERHYWCSFIFLLCSLPHWPSELPSESRPRGGRLGCGREALFMGTISQRCWNSSLFSCGSCVDHFCFILGRLDFLIAPKDSNEEKPFSKLADHVEERKEEKWSDDFRGEGHIEDGRAELDILASGLHADSAAALSTEAEDSREDVAQQKAEERHQGRGGPQAECHDKHDALAHIDDRERYDDHSEQQSDDHPSLDDVAHVLWSFGIEEDPYGARNENQDQGQHNASIGYLLLQVPIIDPPAVNVQEEGHHAQGKEGGAGGHHDAEVHVPLQGQTEDIGQVSPRRTAADQDGQCLNVVQPEDLTHQKGGEGHYAVLRHQGNGQPLGLPEVSLDLAELHGAAQREHHDEQHGHQDDAQCQIGGALAKVGWQGEVERG